MGYCRSSILPSRMERSCTHAGNGLQIKILQLVCFPFSVGLTNFVFPLTYFGMSLRVNNHVCSSQIQIDPCKMFNHRQGSWEQPHRPIHICGALILCSCVYSLWFMQESLAFCSDVRESEWTLHASQIKFCATQARTHIHTHWYKDTLAAGTHSHKMAKRQKGGHKKRL